MAPGYTADLLVLEDLDTVKVRDVYHCGVRVAQNGRLSVQVSPMVPEALQAAVRRTFALDAMMPADFHIDAQGRRACRVIRQVPGELLTEEWVTEIDFAQSNGIDIGRDILKLAVIERHRHTGHRGLGFLAGTGLKCGAIASSVAHDAHNLIVVGANEMDMAAAANHVRALGGGCVVVRDGEVLAETPLPVAGLMSDGPGCCSGTAEPAAARSGAGDGSFGRQ